jgi:hypothetical protein
MTSVTEIIDEVLDRSFEIECAEIVLRGRDDHVPPFFLGPGMISGRRTGPFRVRLHNELEKNGKEIIKLWREPPMMCCDAIDYFGNKWTGGWLHPMIHGQSATRCWIEGQFPQLSVDIRLSAFETFRDTTVLYYANELRLPMLEVAEIQRKRGSEVEQISTDWDRTELDFEGSRVVVHGDAEKGRTLVSTSHTQGWGPPYCEVGLADSIGFSCSTPARPRVVVRYLKDRAILFVRETPSDAESRLPRPIAYRGPRDAAFWNLFLAMLRHCRQQQEWPSTRLSRLFAELISSSTGTFHAFVLSLVLGIEDLVEQIVGKPQRVPEIASLKEYLAAWPGDSELREAAIRVVSSFLSRTSSRAHLKSLRDKNIVTSAELEAWESLRPSLAHGKTLNYEDEQLWERRNECVMMCYRLALRVLNYRGEMSDHTTSPPGRFDFQWVE